jgi:hypothetical protein
VTRIGFESDTLYHRTFHYRPTSYTEEDLDSIAARAARGEAGGMAMSIPGRGPPADWERIAPSLREEMDFPELRVPIQYPWVAQDGSLWIRWMEGGRATTNRWVLLDAEANPRGQLELPSRLVIEWARGDTFWAVEPDEYDVPWVVRFRIQGE